jgi:hypothetical protein
MPYRLSLSSTTRSMAALVRISPMSRSSSGESVLTTLRRRFGIGHLLVRWAAVPRRSSARRRLECFLAVRAPRELCHSRTSGFYSFRHIDQIIGESREPVYQA